MRSAFDDRTVLSTRFSVLKTLYRWFVCHVSVPGTVHSPSTLAWGMGSGAPQNPTCQAVNVARHYAGQGAPFELLKF